MENAVSGKYVKVCKNCGATFFPSARPDYSDLCVICDPPEKRIPPCLKSTGRPKKIRHYKFNTVIIHRGGRNVITYDEGIC